MIENRYSRRRLPRSDARARSTIRALRSHAVFILIALVALAVQTLLVQPHIHLQTAQRTYVRNGIASTKTTTPSIEGLSPEPLAEVPRDRYPINEDPSNCPLCQEISHSENFVPSAAKFPVAPLFATVMVEIFQRRLSLSLAASHIWQGRAPPHPQLPQPGR